MTDFSAVPVIDALGSTVSQDGRFVLLEFALANGGERLALAIPHDKAMGVMGLLSDAAGKAARIQTSDPNVKHIFPLDWWEIGENTENQMIVLSFRLPGGMEMAFQVHRDAANRMMETLSTLLGKGAPTRQPGTSAH